MDMSMYKGKILWNSRPKHRTTEKLITIRGKRISLSQGRSPSLVVTCKVV